MYIFRLLDERGFKENKGINISGVEQTELCPNKSWPYLANSIIWHENIKIF